MKNREERIKAIDRMHRDLSLLANIDPDIAKLIMRLRHRLSDLSIYIERLEYTTRCGDCGSKKIQMKRDPDDILIWACTNCAWRMDLTIKGDGK